MKSTYSRIPSIIATLYAGTAVAGIILDHPASLVTLEPYAQLRLSMYADSRATVPEDRGGDFLLYPKKRTFVECCEDTDNRPRFHFTPIETRLGFIARAKKPWFCTNVKGVLEVDFFGRSELSARDGLSNILRLRHAYTHFEHEQGAFLIGQYWHPLYIEDCRPEVVSFNTGSPFDQQDRCPQIRASRKFSCFELMGALTAQHDNQSSGPDGGSSIYMRRAMTPNAHAQLRFIPTKNLVLGLAGDFKRIVPRAVSSKNLPIDESLASWITECYAAYKQEKYSARTKFFYAENPTEHLMNGGYAIVCKQEPTGRQVYAPTRIIGAWFDASVTLDCYPVELGIFAAGSKNLGTAHPLTLDSATNQPTLFGSGMDIDYLFRLSPRAKFDFSPVKFGLELEWTRASYGTPNSFARITNGTPADNIRALMIFYYVF